MDVTLKPWNCGSWADSGHFWKAAHQPNAARYNYPVSLSDSFYVRSPLSATSCPHTRIERLTIGISGSHLAWLVIRAWFLELADRGQVAKGVLADSRNGVGTSFALLIITDML